MGKKKAKVKPIHYACALLVIVGLVLVVVGMFVGQVVAKTESALAGASSSTTYKLFDDIWGTKEVAGKTVGVSNVFAIISFIVAIVGAAIALVDCIARVCLKKKLPLVGLIGVVVAAAGAVMILISGLNMVSACGDGLDLGVLIKYTYSAGAGVWLGFVGGLLGALGGLGVLLVK